MKAHLAKAKKKHNVKFPEIWYGMTFPGQGMELMRRREGRGSL